MDGSNGRQQLYRLRMYTKWTRTQRWEPDRSAFPVRLAPLNPLLGTSPRQRSVEPSSQPGELAERPIPGTRTSEKLTSRPISWMARTHPSVERDRAERVETLAFEATGAGVADEPRPAVATMTESPVREEPISDGPAGSVARGGNDPFAGAGGAVFCFRITNDPIWLTGGSVARGGNDPFAGTGGGADCFRITNDPIWLGAAAEAIRCPADQSGAPSQSATNAGPGTLTVCSRWWPHQESPLAPREDQNFRRAKVDFDAAWTMR